MVAPSRVHPLTFFGRAPRGTTNTDLCKELVKRFAQTDLRAVQDFGAGRFEIVFRTKAMVDRFLADPVLKVRENEIKFEYRGVRTKIVRVLGYPCQDGEQALIRELGAYGKVLGVQHESVKDFALVPSGILRVRMEMNCPVPNLLKVDGRFAQCEYEGVVRLCRRCNLAGHHADACTTPRCAEFGHAECDVACKRCGGGSCCERMPG
ncbi:hypothetical protein HPB50_014840 [Hyalomma asiaticum]|uniref:Uncharacterized protein n=1 Tax=Hyalomma asiaticum TaxID=266040 RepID=A0ACB7SWB5_HYAAI|nr:hypothetical protein HPB50_014840 [Hyalomma asiaticum]